ncbi:unnamed protein product [Toxocara canis]|uniref:Secreted protein n=1 Tax=Toxocara canis TaxID=6265 RepID=A0A183VFG7_TOXCA|nr:unnamed protein product [Toxocara canis]
MRGARWCGVWRCVVCGDVVHGDVVCVCMCLRRTREKRVLRTDCKEGRRGSLELDALKGYLCGGGAGSAYLLIEVHQCCILALARRFDE